MLVSRLRARISSSGFWARAAITPILPPMRPSIGTQPGAVTLAWRGMSRRAWMLAVAALAALAAPGAARPRCRARRPTPIPRDPLTQRPAFIGSAATPRPVQWPGRPPAPVHGAERALQHPRRRLPDRHLPLGRARWATDLATTSALFAARVRLDHLRLPRPPRDDLRRARTSPCSRCSTRTRSRSLATMRPAAAKRQHEPVPGLQRRRLLLPRQPRPGGDPGRRTATSSWSARPAAPRTRLRARARLRPHRRGAPTATRSSRRFPTGTGGSGSPARRGGGDDRAGERRGAQHRHRASRSATRSRSTRPAGVYIVTDKAMYRFDARDGQAGRHLAAHVPEHRRRQAGPDRGGIRDHADPDRPPLRGDHRQRRPDGRRRLQASGSRWTGAARGLQLAGVQRRAPAPPTSR